MIFCQRCGAELPPGSLKYLVTVHVTADFDGTLPAEGAMEDLEAFMRRLDAGDAAVAENDVHQSQGYLLCPACKKAFLANPLGLEAEHGGGDGGAVH